MNKPKTIRLKAKYIDQHTFDGWIEYIQIMAYRRTGKVMPEQTAYRYLKDCIESMLADFIDSAQWPDLLGYDEAL